MQKMMLVGCLFLFSILTIKSETNVDNDPYFICRELHKYGCAPTTIDPNLKALIEGTVPDYTLPTNPCDFESINGTIIFASFPADLLLLPIVTDDDFVNTPCELLIQIHNEILPAYNSDVLTIRNLTYLIDYGYWFNDSNCDISNTSNALNCDNTTYVASNDECYNPNCFAPFLVGRFKTDYLTDFGMCYCSRECGAVVLPDGIDMKTIDLWNSICGWVSFALCIAYFINLYLGVKQQRQLKIKLPQIPITYDIPFFVCLNLFIWCLCNLTPHIIGKKYQTCDAKDDYKTETWLTNPRDNPFGFFMGSVFYLSLMGIYLYFGLLSWSIWRYLFRPLKPLFRLKKKYFHLGVWIINIGLYTSFAFIQDEMSCSSELAVCGPAIFKDHISLPYVFIPGLLVLLIFIIYTPLSVYKINRHIRSTKLVTNMNNSNIESPRTNSVNPNTDELVHLSIRLIIYSCLLALSVSCWLYVIGEFIFNYDTIESVTTEYILCVGLNSGDESKCQGIVTNDGISIILFFMQGIIMLLVSIGSFILSCSNQRYKDWKSKSIQSVRRATSLKLGSRTSKINDDFSANPTPKSKSSNNINDNTPNIKMSKLKLESIQLSGISMDNDSIITDNDNDGLKPPRMVLMNTNSTLSDNEDNNDNNTIKTDNNNEDSTEM